MGDMAHITFIEGVRLGLTLLSMVMFCMLSIAIVRSLWLHFDHERYSKKHKVCPFCKVKGKDIE